MCSRQKTLIFNFLVFGIGLCLLPTVGVAADPDLTVWLSRAQATAGNVTADATGWTIDGTAGVPYDYGTLGGTEASVEYIFNISDTSGSVALGSVFGSGAQRNTYKLEQWNNQGIFGVTTEGVIDATFPGATSTFDVDTHVVFVNLPNGTQELYVNGVSQGTDSRGSGWQTAGGAGFLGQNSGGVDVGVGSIYGVASYNRALSAAEVSALYVAYGTSRTAGNPEPADGSRTEPTGDEGDGHYMLLQFTAGHGATTHTAYFSSNFDDVDTRSPSALLGSPPYPTTYPTGYYVGLDDPALPDFARTPLERGVTYYWAVDESNDTASYPGTVWSFSIATEWAWGPYPADGAGFIPTDVTATWLLGDVNPGGNILTYDVYIGTDETAVAEARTPDGPYKGNVGTESYDFTGLADGIEHFWRIDTKVTLTRPPFTSTITEGEVWSFTTLPEPPVVPIVDVNMVGWWELDGDVVDYWVFDSSGYANHGEPQGDPAYVAGQVDGAMEFDGDDWVNCGTPPELVLTDKITVACWVNPTGFVGRRAFAGLDGGYTFKVHGGGVLSLTTPGILDMESPATILTAGTWQHVAATFEAGQAGGMAFFLNGVETDRIDASTINTGGGPFRIGSNQWDETLTGQLDDVRVYNRILSEKEIRILAGFLKASPIDPPDGAVDASRTPTLSWMPGVYAATANGSVLYYGADEDAVINRTAPSVTLSTAPFVLPMTLDLGQTFYWTVDTVNGVDTWPGDVWSFTTVNWLSVDDMEIYTPWTTPGDNIFEAWRDGEGNCAPGNGNQTGSTLTENLDAAFVLGGLQSMKYDFDNDGLVYSPCTMSQSTRPHLYSRIEAQVATLPSGIGSNWTLEGVKALQINFMGQLGNSTTDPLWVQLQDSSKAYGTKVFYGDFEGEALADMNDPSWHQWDIDLADFNVDLTNVVSIVIGIGNEGSAVPGGSGTIYVDEIRLYTPRCVPNRAKPAGDFDNSCQVDYPDVATLFDNWLLEDVPEVADGGWMTTDIGDVNVLTGSYTDLGGGEFTMTGAGADIWGTADGGFYRYRLLSGDGRLTVRVTNIAGPSTNAWRKAGVMIRETLDAGSKHAFMATSPGGGGGKSLQRRTTTDGSSSSTHGIPPTVTAPICLRIARQGDTFRGFYNIGGGWVQQGDPVTIEMAEDVYIGFAITSHDYSNSTTVTFDNVCSGDFIAPDLISDGVINFEDYAEMMDEWMEPIHWP